MLAHTPETLEAERVATLAALVEAYDKGEDAVWVTASHSPMYPYIEAQRDLGHFELYEIPETINRDEILLAGGPVAEMLRQVMHLLPEVVDLKKMGVVGYRLTDLGRAHHGRKN